MVRKGVQMDKFDSIKTNLQRNAEIAIGTNSETDTEEIELYDKNLVLTGEWDKLPVLEKISCTPEGQYPLGVAMEASGQNTLQFRLMIYNCEEDDIDEDHLIDQFNVIVSQDSNVIYCFDADHVERDFNIPLRNKISIVRYTALSGNAAGTAFPANRIQARLFFNIDWVKYSKEDLKDWILKEVFIDS